MKKSLLGCLFFVSLFAAGQAWGADVVLRATREVRGNAIRLSDVFDGLPEGKDCDIAIAPAPGRSVTYELRVLSQLAQQYSLEWRPQSIADRAVLTRAAIQLTPDMIRDAVLKKMGDAGNGEREVQFDGRLTGLYLAAEDAPTFELANFTYDAERRRFRTDLIAISGGYPLTQTLSGHVIYKREIPVLARALPAGSVIGEADIKWASVNDERIGEDILTSADQIVGMELRRNQSEDDRLRLRDIMPPRLVLRGEIVTIKVETPMMLITAQGRALQDGAKGETVRIVNTQSNRTIEGTVEATGVVRVGDAVRMASMKTQGAVR